MDTKGLRSTDQRRLIVETFFHAPNHVSIEELLAQVRALDPKVGYATVYRTLKLMAESRHRLRARASATGSRATSWPTSRRTTTTSSATECGGITEFEEPRDRGAAGQGRRELRLRAAEPQARAVRRLPALPGQRQVERVDRICQPPCGGSDGIPPVDGAQSFFGPRAGGAASVTIRVDCDIAIHGGDLAHELEVEDDADLQDGGTSASARS